MDSGNKSTIDQPLIPKKRAEYFLNRAAVDRPPTEFVVIDQKTRFDPDKRTLDDPYKHLSGSGGAHSRSWLDGSDAPHSSPEAVFAHLWLDSSADRASIKNGLAELAKIEGCEWAAKMLATLRWIDEHWRK